MKRTSYSKKYDKRIAEYTSKLVKWAQERSEAGDSEWAYRLATLDIGLLQLLGEMTDTIDTLANGETLDKHDRQMMMIDSNYIPSGKED